jgi:hypothetical protein
LFLLKCSYIRSQICIFWRCIGRPCAVPSDGALAHMNHDLPLCLLYTHRYQQSMCRGAVCNSSYPEITDVEQCTMAAGLLGLPDTFAEYAVTVTFPSRCVACLLSLHSSQCSSYCRPTGRPHCYPIPPKLLSNAAPCVLLGCFATGGSIAQTSLPPHRASHHRVTPPPPTHTHTHIRTVPPKPHPQPLTLKRTHTHAHARTH